MKIELLKSAKFLIAVLLLTNILQPAASQELGSIKHEKCLLWKISGNGLVQPSYMFGTVHIIDSAYYFLEETVIEKFIKCEKIVCEVDKSDPEFQQKTLSVLMMENDSLDNMISRAEYEKVKTFFSNELNIPLEKVKKIKPYYLTSFVASINIPEHFKSYEDELLKIVDSQNQEILGVSTVEKESEILVDRIPLGIQTKMLLNAIDGVDELAEISEQLIKSYRDKDIDRFYELTKRESNDYEVVFESMFQKRHEVWIPNMLQLMSKNSCFFALGVAHLAGEEGLIELLKHHGYKVESVF